MKEARLARGLSQRDLAARAGLTNGAISMIEQNKNSPSVASLKSLLDALSLTLSEFFVEVEQGSRAKYFYSKPEFTELSPAKYGLTGAEAGDISLRQLGDARHHALQVLYETYPPGADTGRELLKHQSEEAGIVISGQIEITVADQISVLAPGDGYLFDSRLPHRFRNIGNEPCVVVSACTPPSF